MNRFTRRSGLARGLALVAGSAALFGSVPPAVVAEPAGAPAATPGAADAAAVDPKVKTLLEYLEKDAYGKKLTAPFWVSRAMGVISLARLPQASATTRLLEVAENDKHDVVRLLAWQAVLARAPDLDAKQHKRWLAAALALADKDAFRGWLRVTLLDALATAPPSARAKRLWDKLYVDASAWEPQDMPTLDALGRTLSTWRSGALAERLVRDLTDPNNCVRAEYVLRAAGSDVPTVRASLKPSVFDSMSQDRQHPSSADLWSKSQAASAAWLREHRAEWKELTAVEGEPWKLLQPLYVAAPVPLDQIDPKDPLWAADLELGRADLGQIEAVFVVDATGSMGDVLDWLRRDVARIMQAFALLSKEAPSVGIVFYRDVDVPPVVRSLPMTYKLADLMPKLTEEQAEGGGDIPEAVLDGLKAAVDGMRWSKSKGTPPPAKSGAAAKPAAAVKGTAAAKTESEKVMAEQSPAGGRSPAADGAATPTDRRARTGKMIVLIGDAPPKPRTEALCEAVAKRGADAGIRTYACKVTTVEGRNDLSTFDAIAAAGGGSTVEASFVPLTMYRFIGPNGKPMKLQTIDRPEAQLVVASGSAEQPPGEKILAHLLTDLISPEYKDRVDPLARTLLAHVQPKSDPEKRLAFPANTPPLNKAKFDAQKK